MSLGIVQKKPTPKTELEQVLLMEGWLIRAASVGFLQARRNLLIYFRILGGRGQGLLTLWVISPCSLSLPLIHSFKIVGNGGFFSPWGSMERLLSNLLEAWVEWEWN